MVPTSEFCFCILLFFFFFFFFFLHTFQGTSATEEYCSVLFGRVFLTFLSISGPVHCLWTHKFHFLSIFSLKMSPTVLFTHLKIILLQCFQFSVFSFSKISSIQTHPKSSFLFWDVLIYSLTWKVCKLITLLNLYFN